ncbi:MAG: LamG-like jellyroll fold domain-containing protein [Bacteroidia bacterium]|nr:LamG-like jellyroll fold domain-containing protein [Bacteroidia bacterium]
MLAQLKISGLLLLPFLILPFLFAQQNPVLKLDFEPGQLGTQIKGEVKELDFVEGIEGKALALGPEEGKKALKLSGLSLDGSKDFTICFWMKADSDKPMVFLSQKIFGNKSITTQKNPGWVIYSSGGSMAWSIGSGERRINYERDNGSKMPINDGEWHQLAMSFKKELKEVRLYYDGGNVAVYKVNFDFSNEEILNIGAEVDSYSSRKFAAGIEQGKEELQSLLDSFNALGLAPLKKEEFIELIVNPEMLYEKKLAKRAGPEEQGNDVLGGVQSIRKNLLSNPYTVFQNRALTDLKAVSQIYELQEGKVEIRESEGKLFTQKEQLYPPDFSIDNLSIWDRVLDEKELEESYRILKKKKVKKLPKKRKELTIGVWNIWHGGIHWTKEKEGWDSRLRIVEMIREKEIDVLLMQETYSSGDFIAAELGYYFATTSDWDYRYQGSNISVISRFPIKELQVSDKTEFNNVATRLAISRTQEIWAMSNWYGMAQFGDVFSFHEERFENSDHIPVFFGGDFNAVPHTDGGDSPASLKLSEAGFTEAFRNMYPDVEKYPGYTHRSASRIDQLYYKGKDLKNTHTEVNSSWPTGFPSDHYLIVSTFKLP